MTKRLHAGLAAKNGVLAAKLAKDGFTSNFRILERPKGFFQTFARDLPVENGPLDNLGAQFDLVETGIRIKSYPCGGRTHSAVDALLALRARHGITREEVERIHVSVTQQTHESIVYHRPETGLQGKFSMPYILARALIQGRLRLDDFTDEAIKDISVRELAEKISMEHEPELKDDGTGRRPSRVVIHLKDGRTLSHRVDYPKGGREVPLIPEEVRGKFMECAGTTMGAGAIDQAIEHLGRLEEFDHLEPLFQLLRGELANRRNPG